MLSERKKNLDSSVDSNTISDSHLGNNNYDFSDTRRCAEHKNWCNKLDARGYFMWKITKATTEHKNWCNKLDTKATFLLDVPSFLIINAIFPLFRAFPGPRLASVFRTEVTTISMNS